MQKVIIIDDEAAGRLLIRQYLEAYPALIVVGEANNGVDERVVRLICDATIPWARDACAYGVRRDAVAVAFASSVRSRPLTLDRISHEDDCAQTS